MPLYRMMNSVRRLEPFHSTDFGVHYLEKDLEDWLEDNPQVLVADEPLLIIGRQVNTPVGIIDLLALDTEGAVIIAELKRAPEQRGAIGQALEYAAWIAIQTPAAIYQLAERHLSKSRGITLSNAWQEIYNSELVESNLNSRQRIFIVIEGIHERLISVANYLRQAKVDISLLSYNYYRTTNNEELLQIEMHVGDDEPLAVNARSSSQLLTETTLVNSWNRAVQQAYFIFKEKMEEHGIVTEVKRSQISFRKQTIDGRVFICGYHGAGDNFRLWLRSDSLQNHFNFQIATQRIEDRIKPAVAPKLTPTWYLLTIAATPEMATVVADVLIKEVVDQIT